MKPVDLSTQYGFGWLKSLSEALAVLIVPAFGIASAAVLFYFLFGAVKIITSSGDKEKVASARNMITHAFIGLLLLVMTFVLLQVIPGLFNVDITFFR